MTKDEIKELAQALQKPPSEQAKYIDWLFKALIGVLVYLGTGLKQEVKDLRTDVNVVKADVTKMATESNYSKEDMKDVKSFISVPRFTSDDFDNKITPLQNQVNQNTTELNARAPVIDGLQEKFIRIELKLDALLKQNDK